MRALQIQMRNIGLGHFERIGPRTLRSLQYLNLIDNESPPIGKNVDLEVLSDLGHKMRQGHPIGPLLLYGSECREKKRMLVDIPVIFLSEDRNIRSAALKSLDDMVTDNSLAFTPRTASILDDLRDKLLSTKPEDWKPAAVDIFDALNDDVLIALNGVRQSLDNEPVIEDSLNTYTPRLLHPSVSSLDSISLPIGQPERDHEALKTHLAHTIANAKSLEELCDLYYDSFGFLPLAKAYSLALAIEEWIGSRDNIDVWRGVWEWADTAATPLAQYHACSVFVSLPHLIPESNFPDLWNKLLKVIECAGRKGENPLSCERWLLRKDLARHYAFHLEARLPYNDGASIACFAWWFAEKVAALFPDDDESAQFYRENWVKPASDLSSHTWLVANAHVGTSFLRHATFTVQAPWALSLLALLGENISRLFPLEQSENVRLKFQEALIANALWSMPFTITLHDNATFALECSLEKTLKGWQEFCSDENRDVFETIISMNRSLGSKQGLCDALREIKDSKLPDQVATLAALKKWAYSDPMIAENLWELVSCPEWRNKTFSSLKNELQDILIEALSQLMIANRDKWCHYLPHYIAEICEHENDHKRRRKFFLYVLHLCLASDTISAVKRLLQSDRKSDYLEEVEVYRSQVEAMRSNYPPWVAGKLRAMIASMHVH